MQKSQGKKVEPINSVIDKLNSSSTGFFNTKEIKGVDKNQEIMQRRVKVQSKKISVPPPPRTIQRQVYNSVERTRFEKKISELDFKPTESQLFQDEDQSASRSKLKKNDSGLLPK
jgi:hypothetical protein